jgi:hypothetical protein
MMAIMVIVVVVVDVMCRKLLVGVVDALFVCITFFNVTDVELLDYDGCSSWGVIFRRGVKSYLCQELFLTHCPCSHLG